MYNYYGDLSFATEALAGEVRYDMVNAEDINNAGPWKKDNALPPNLYLSSTEGEVAT